MVEVSKMPHAALRPYDHWGHVSLMDSLNEIKVQANRSLICITANLLNTAVNKIEYKFLEGCVLRWSFRPNSVGGSVF